MLSANLLIVLLPGKSAKYEKPKNTENRIIDITEIPTFLDFDSASKVKLPSNSVIFDTLSTNPNATISIELKIYVYGIFSVIIQIVNLIKKGNNPIKTVYNSHFVFVISTKVVFVN